MWVRATGLSLHYAILARDIFPSFGQRQETSVVKQTASWKTLLALYWNDQLVADFDMSICPVEASMKDP